mgnify:CR=1 FL=1
MNGKLILSAVFVLLMIVSGFTVSRTGRPYNGLLFTIHKLISLGTLVYLVINFNRVDREILFSMPVILVCLLTAILFISLFATGGMLSAMKSPSAFIERTHHILPYLLAVTTLTGIHLAGI